MEFSDGLHFAPIDCNLAYDTERMVDAAVDLITRFEALGHSRESIFVNVSENKLPKDYLGIV